MHGPSSGPEVAAYIAFYPMCKTTYLHDDDVVDRPIRIFHGTADDYVPVAPCRSYVERLRKAGKDVQLTEYPDAHHVFDWPMLKTPLTLAQARTGRRCHREEGPVGRILNSVTKQPFSSNDPCVERGVTLAYHPQAHSEAQRAISEFVATRLKAK
jgi:dienelactone hydrolase